MLLKMKKTYVSISFYCDKIKIIGRIFYCIFRLISATVLNWQIIPEKQADIN